MNINVFMKSKAITDIRCCYIEQLSISQCSSPCNNTLSPLNKRFLWRLINISMKLPKKLRAPLEENPQALISLFCKVTHDPGKGSAEIDQFKAK